MVGSSEKVKNMFKKKFPSLSSLGSDGNTSFLRAARAGHLDKVLEQLRNNVDINTSNANGLNALHLASKDGHVHVVTELLKRGANVDSATKKGNTALHIASLAGQEDVVKLLVEHGASVNVQSQNGFTPLYMAAQENHDNVVKYLLANGANQSLATEDGFTPLAVAMQQGHDKVVAVLLENDTRGKVRLPALHIAAKKDDCKAAALLLQNEHNPDVTSKSGFTPLHIASHYGNEGIANLLLNKGADVNYSAKHNITPLHVAAKWGKSNMVSLLLEKGANIESKTRDGLTPLHCAARSGHEQVVDMLLERGAPISCKTKNGLAPLHMSSQGDHVDAARILLYHRAPVDEVTVDYLTALHVAAHCGHARVAKLLLDRKADPNARALNGFTPLHIACKKNRIKVVELLLKHGASIEATTESGLTPLHVASFMGCMNIVIYLLQNDASPDVPTVRGETPLHLAARANQTDIIRILLRNGAQVDARAREQQTPLHIASRLGNVDIVMLLLQHGAAVDCTTKDLYSALHIAAKEGQDEVASVLLENGASPTATTKKGFTPLHLAAKYGNMKVAKLLLQRDAPVDAQGKNGVTPLHVASHYDHQNVALLLLDKGASPHATAKNGHTPLHIAARKNQMDIATTLLEYGAKANSESKAGFTPLHLSAQEGHVDMSSLLIDHHADTNHKAKNGLTPLHLCAQEDRTNVASVLVKNSAEVDATTKAGYTPLHVACHFGQLNMVRFLLEEGSKADTATAVGYTPLHQAAQQGHSAIVNTLLEHGAPPNATTNQGQTALSIAQKLGYISVVESLKSVTDVTTITPIASDEKYKVVSPETMQETFMSDSEDEGGEDTLLSEQPYRYLTVDEMKSLGDDSLPIDVRQDERMDSNRECMSVPPTAQEDSISPAHLKESYSQFNTPDNIDITKHPLHIGFLVSFLVDARGGAMRGCRHSGVRMIVPPRRASMPMRVTCRYLRRDKLSHPPPLMEGEALASRILELGPVGAKFLGPVMIEVPHFGSLRGKEREIVILRSDNGETWREHTVDCSEEAVQDILSHSFDKEDMVQLDDSGRTTRILTTDFPHYFAVVTRVRQEVHAIGPEGGMVSSSVVPQVQAVFPQGALTKKIKVGLQAQPIPAELAAKLLGNRVAVSPIVTVEPRRRKFHKPITLTIPKPQAANKGMINQYSGDAPTLRLLCSITGGTTRAQWEDVTGSTPFTFVNDCVSFTTTVSARFWLMDCRNVGDATKMATELYRDAIHVPFMAKFVVFAKRVDPLEARLRIFCMTDDKEDKTLEHQEHFTEVAKSRDVEVLEGKTQYVEFAGNLVPVTKSGEQLQLSFRAFRENRLPFTVRVKDPHADCVGRTLFMREARLPKGEAPQQPICVLNIVLPDEIIPEAILIEHELHKYSFIQDSSGLESYQRVDLRLSDISNLLGADWVSLAEVLEVAPSDINRLKTEYPQSVAQQGLAMLRLWVSQAGNKAQASTLESALSQLGRDDIVQQCVFNVDQSGLQLLKDESRDASFRRSIPYSDKDIMRDSESVEDLSRKSFRKTGDFQEKDDKEERKYEAEEKEVEEVKKSVSERRKEIENRLSMDKQLVKNAEAMSTKLSAETMEDRSEKETAEEKRVLSPEEEPSELTFHQKRLSFEQGKRVIEMKPDKMTMKEVNERAMDEKFIIEERKAAEALKQDRSMVDETSLSFSEKRRSFEEKEKKGDLKKEDLRRDSALFEGVSQGLVHLDAAFTATPQVQDLLMPKVSKTPPPSPAEFKDLTGTVAWTEEPAAVIPAKLDQSQDWAEKGKPDSTIDPTQKGLSRTYNLQKTQTQPQDKKRDISVTSGDSPILTDTNTDINEEKVSEKDSKYQFTMSVPDKKAFSETLASITSFLDSEKKYNDEMMKCKPGRVTALADSEVTSSDETEESQSRNESDSKSDKTFMGKMSKKIRGVFKKDDKGKSENKKQKKKKHKKSEETQQGTSEHDLKSKEIIKLPAESTKNDTIKSVSFPEIDADIDEDMPDIMDVKDKTHDFDKDILEGKIKTTVDKVINKVSHVTNLTDIKPDQTQSTNTILNDSVNCVNSLSVTNEVSDNEQIKNPPEERSIKPKDITGIKTHFNDEIDIKVFDDKMDYGDVNLADKAHKTKEIVKTKIGGDTSIAEMTQGTDSNRQNTIELHLASRELFNTFGPTSKVSVETTRSSTDNDADKEKSNETDHLQKVNTEPTISTAVIPSAELSTVKSIEAFNIVKNEVPDNSNIVDIEISTPTPNLTFDNRRKSSGDKTVTVTDIVKSGRDTVTRTSISIVEEVIEKTQSTIKQGHMNTNNCVEEPVKDGKTKKGKRFFGGFFSRSGEEIDTEKSKSNDQESEILGRNQVKVEPETLPPKDVLTPSINSTSKLQSVDVEIDEDEHISVSNKSNVLSEHSELTPETKDITHVTMHGILKQTEQYLEDRQPKIDDSGKSTDGNVKKSKEKGKSFFSGIFGKAEDVASEEKSKVQDSGILTSELATETKAKLIPIADKKIDKRTNINVGEKSKEYDVPKTVNESTSKEMFTKTEFITEIETKTVPEAVNSVTTEIGQGNIGSKFDYVAPKNDEHTELSETKTDIKTENINVDTKSRKKSKEKSKLFFGTFFNKKENDFEYLKDKVEDPDIQKAKMIKEQKEVTNFQADVNAELNKKLSSIGEVVTKTPIPEQIDTAPKFENGAEIVGVTNEMRKPTTIDVKGEEENKEVSNTIINQTTEPLTLKNNDKTIIPDLSQSLASQLESKADDLDIKNEQAIYEIEQGMCEIGKEVPKPAKKSKEKTKPFLGGLLTKAENLLHEKKNKVPQLKNKETVPTLEVVSDVKIENKTLVDSSSNFTTNEIEKASEKITKSPETVVVNAPETLYSIEKAVDDQLKALSDISDKTLDQVSCQTTVVIDSNTNKLENANKVLSESVEKPYEKSEPITGSIFIKIGETIDPAESININEEAINEGSQFSDSGKLSSDIKLDWSAADKKLIILDNENNAAVKPDGNSIYITKKEERKPKVSLGDVCKQPEHFFTGNKDNLTSVSESVCNMSGQVEKEITLAKQSIAESAKDIIDKAKLKGMSVVQRVEFESGCLFGSAKDKYVDSLKTASESKIVEKSFENKNLEKKYIDDENMQSEVLTSPEVESLMITGLANVDAKEETKEACKTHSSVDLKDIVHHKENVLEDIKAVQGDLNNFVSSNVKSVKVESQSLLTSVTSQSLKVGEGINKDHLAESIDIAKKTSTDAAEKNKSAVEDGFSKTIGKLTESQEKAFSSILKDENVDTVKENPQSLKSNLTKNVQGATDNVQSKTTNMLAIIGDKEVAFNKDAIEEGSNIAIQMNKTMECYQDRQETPEDLDKAEEMTEVAGNKNHDIKGTAYEIKNEVMGETFKFANSMDETAKDFFEIGKAKSLGAFNVLQTKSKDIKDEISSVKGDVTDKPSELVNNSKMSLTEQTKTVIDTLDKNSDQADITLSASAINLPHVTAPEKISGVSVGGAKNLVEEIAKAKHEIVTGVVTPVSYDLRECLENRLKTENVGVPSTLSSFSESAEKVVQKMYNETENVPHELKEKSVSGEQRLIGRGEEVIDGSTKHLQALIADCIPSSKEDAETLERNPLTMPERCLNLAKTEIDNYSSILTSGMKEVENEGLSQFQKAVTIKDSLTGEGKTLINEHISGVKKAAKGFEAESITPECLKSNLEGVSKNAKSKLQSSTEAVTEVIHSFEVPIEKLNGCFSPIKPTDEIASVTNNDDQLNNILIDMLIEQESIKATQGASNQHVLKKEQAESHKSSAIPEKHDIEHSEKSENSKTGLKSAASYGEIESLISEGDILMDLEREAGHSSYVTTPTMERRKIGGSQRLSREERPALREVSHIFDYSSSDDEGSNLYIVTEPTDKKVTFHVESEDETFFKTLDSSSEPEVEVTEIISSPNTSKKHTSEVNRKQGKDQTKPKQTTNKNLQKAERRFERMASETLEADPAASYKADKEFQRMVSQLSSEEVDACLNQWEEEGLTPSEELDSTRDTLEGDLDPDVEALPEASLKSTNPFFSESVKWVPFEQDLNNTPSSIFWAFDTTPTSTVIHPNELDIPVKNMSAQGESAGEETSKSPIPPTAREGDEALMDLAAGVQDPKGTGHSGTK